MPESARLPRRTAGRPISSVDHGPSPTERPERSIDGHRGTHKHLWTLPDGTGLHAPHGQLVRDPDTGQVCCHLCGLWFRSLGSHLRRHGYTAADYREAMGLCRTRPMTSDELSGAISLRQAAAYHRDPEVRSRLAEGQAMIRSGQGATKARATDRESPAELVAVRREAQRRGRETRNRQRDQAVQARLAELGCADLGGYLSTAYAAGASLADLGAATGLGTVRLRRAMAAAGIAVRRPGDTTPAGRRSRALAAEREAAARIGIDDISTWLTQRYADGWSLSRLAEAVGHSAPWVRWRLSPAAQ